eukprot:4213970-Prymnesium_polylepis.1
MHQRRVSASEKQMLRHEWTEGLNEVEAWRRLGECSEKLRRYKHAAAQFHEGFRLAKRCKLLKQQHELAYKLALLMQDTKQEAADGADDADSEIEALLREELRSMNTSRREECWRRHAVRWFQKVRRRHREALSCSRNAATPQRHNATRAPSSH